MRKQPDSGIKSRNLKGSLQTELLSFEQLGASTLLTDFLLKKDSLAPFFGVNSFSNTPIELAKEVAQSYSQSSRELLVPLLSEQNRRWGASEHTLANIDKLRDPKSVVVVTGHQLSLFGGPLFTIYKILSVLLLTDKLKKDFNINALPFFWLADEDHDLPEVLEYALTNKEEAPFEPFHKQVEFKNENLPVGRARLPEEINEILIELAKELKAPFAGETLRLLQNCYSPGTTYKDAFARLLHKWFASSGLILIGGDDLAIKEMAKPVLKMAIQQSKELYSDLQNHTTKLLEAGYHQQVQFEESHLFRFMENGKRQKIKVVGAEWQVDKQTYSKDELLQELEDKPDTFSPGVLLRLGMQSHVLPVLTVIGGPAEIAYAAQSQPFFKRIEAPMPFFQLRYSVSLLELNVNRNLDRLAFPVALYRSRIEELEKEWLNQTLDNSKEKQFARWKSDLQKLYNHYMPEIQEVDITLEASTGRALSIMEKALEHLQVKVTRAQKRKHETELLRLRMVKQALFPLNIPQERMISAFVFYAHYGPEIWNSIAEALRDQTSEHHIILSL